MVSDTFQTFQQFNDPELAAAICEQLQAKGFDCYVEKDAPLLDTNIVGDGMGSATHIKLAAADFTRAHAALEEYYQAQLQAMDPDYYLFSFTNPELLEIIQKPDEWGHLDYVLAKKLLADRGAEVTPVQAEELRQHRITELAKPEKTHPYEVFSGYALAVAFAAGGWAGHGMAAFICGIVGLILGYILGYMKKTLPNGEKVYFYPARERRHGKYILVACAVGMLSWIGWVLSLDGVLPYQHPL